MKGAKTRYGGVTLAGAIAIGCIINQTAAATPDEASSQMPAVTSDVPAIVQAVAQASASPSLSVLSLPTAQGQATAVGYAGQDLILDLSPDLPDRELAFVLQRHDGDSWTSAVDGAASGPQVGIPAVPAGTYRIFVPAQYGMAEFVGAPFVHSPRTLTASLAHQAGELTVSIDPAYTFALQRRSGNGWTDVAIQGTRLSSPAPGTYRVQVPNQADALGSVSNTVTIDSPLASSAWSAPTFTDAPAGPATGGVVGSGMAQLGDRYVHGGSGPDAFDCSGLTSYAYRLNGKSIPRTAGAQYQASAKVGQPQPGDLVFFLNGAEHVGIYLGDGLMVHAANPRLGVLVSRIDTGWYAQHFTGFGRF